MRYIISPAKTMVADDAIAPRRAPQQLDYAMTILQELAHLKSDQQQAIWACSDRLAQQAHQMLDHSARMLADGHDLARCGTPAIYAYQGLQYQHLNAMALSEEQLSWLDEHLRIVSAVFGLLKPLDGVLPYRLEMQAKWAPQGGKSLYTWWGSRLAELIEQELANDPQEDPVLINVASKEYSKAVPVANMVTIDFKRMEHGVAKTRATAAKMARGRFVWWLTEKRPTRVCELRAFAEDGYQFNECYSNDTLYTFIKQS